MDQRIAKALADGRAQLRAGKRAAAIATWKDAMRVAYETQNHAAAFVLSKNLGDATLETRDAVHEAVGYFDYALQLLDGCGLQQDNAFYPPLENVVEYIQRRRRRAQRILEARAHATAAKATRVPFDTIYPGKDSEEIDPPSDQDADGETEEICSTCENPGSRENPIIMDEADGCAYCQACFDAYYAEVEEEEASSLNGLDPGKLAVTETEVGSVQNGSTQGDIALSAGEVADDDTLEVEIFEDEDRATETLVANEAIDETHSSNLPGSSYFTSEVDAFIQAALSHDDPEFTLTEPQEGEIDSQILSEDDDLTTISPQAGKFVYSIQQLKNLRVFDQPCPAEVKSSTVSVTKASEKTQDSRPSSTRTKKPQGKSVKRASTETTTVPPTEHAQAPLQASLLPSLADCEAARSNMASMPSPLQLASALFDAVPENPVPVAASFAAQRELFSTAS